MPLYKDKMHRIWAFNKIISTCTLYTYSHVHILMYITCFLTNLLSAYPAIFQYTHPFWINVIHYVTLVSDWKSQEITGLFLELGTHSKVSFYSSLRVFWKQNQVKLSQRLFIKDNTCYVYECDSYKFQLNYLRSYLITVLYSHNNGIFNKPSCHSNQ
jgi:hypothetical protein